MLYYSVLWLGLGLGLRLRLELYRVRTTVISQIKTYFNAEFYVTFMSPYPFINVSKFNRVFVWFRIYFVHNISYNIRMQLASVFSSCKLTSSRIFTYRPFPFFFLDRDRLDVWCRPEFCCFSVFVPPFQLGIGSWSPPLHFWHLLSCPRLPGNESPCQHSHVAIPQRGHLFY